MGLPQIRFNVGANFPTSIQGLGFVTIAKSGGFWTFKVDYTKLTILATGINPAIKYVAVYDSVSGIYNIISLSALSAAIAGGYTGPIVAAGSYTVQPNDTTVLLQKTAGAATDIILPASATRGGLPITVKDLKGDANANNIRFVMNGVETLDGFSQAAADANGDSKITINHGKKTLFPLTAGGWYL